MSLFELNELNFSYSESKNTAEGFSLKNINLTIERGDFLTVMGPNGSGKTTLIKIIAGLLKQNCGNVKFLGKEIDKYPYKELAKKISVVSQNNSSVFPFSVFEIIMMGRTPYFNIWGFENSNDFKIVNEAIELVDLTHLKNKGINEISGGELQRTFLARALAQQSEVIILDEPNAHLDFKHQISILNLIKNLNKEKNITIIAVLHDINIAAHYSDSIIFMKDGEIVLNGKTDDIISEENIKKVFEIDTTISKLNDRNVINIHYG